MEVQRNLNVRNVDRNIMDSVGHGATHHPTKTHRKEYGNKGTQKGGKSKGGKGGNHGQGKDKGKKAQRLNEITELPEEQWAGESWEQLSDQSWNAEADTASWRDDYW